MAEVSINIGSETDPDCLRRLKAALKRLGARRRFGWWGLGGSQEVTQERYDLLGGVLTVETETYIGITLIGEDHIVERVLENLGG
jgi:hypothetical protein